MACHAQIKGHATPSRLTAPTDLAQYRRDILTVQEAREIDIREFIFIPLGFLFLWGGIARVAWQMAMLSEPVGWFVMGIS